MSVNHWDVIRLRAREKHQVALAAAGGDHSARALLIAAKALTKIHCEAVAAGDPLLCRTARAVLQDDIIWFNDEVPEWEALFNQIHEFAHHWLDGISSVCGAEDLNPEANEDAVEIGARRVEGYSPHERRELEANVFAREFLLPGDYLRDQFLKGKTAADIAEEVGMPDSMVFHQMTRSLLGLDLAELGAPTSNEEPLYTGFELDDSQRRAAQAGWREPERPVLVDAGPGTGKTRALVGRIIHLLKERGVAPSSILALTYSNKAAEEMYSRVKVAAPQDTTQIMMGTFHAFGLELIRKYHNRLGLKSKPEIMDPMEAQLLMERSLERLKLRHYRYLPNPSAPLIGILEAISRAKDELKTPEDYRSAAQAQLDAATDRAARRNAERALEVAEVYAEYEKLLMEQNSLDYGDLIFKAVVLLRDNKDVRDTLRAKYEHILVDEYQDVNTGSRLMLKLLAGDGHGLWVVGDLRQAIYRFRGASPVNMRLLTSEDFPGASVISLRKNYRSQNPVVKLFEICASRMRANTGHDHEAWEVERVDAGGEVRYKVSVDEEAEAREMVEEIERLREAKIEYRDQAVLCRSHRALAEFSQALERAGIPVLYLGNFFERSEVRDLLSVLSLAGEGDGRALFRIAQFPEYDFSFADAKALTRYAFERQCYFPAALKLLPEVSDVSDNGRAKLSLLAEHFADFNFVTNPWKLLVEYLFVKSNYLRELIQDKSPQAQQKRLAIYQFLLLTYQLKDQFDSEMGDPKRQFLNYVRRLKANREERSLRKTPDWADGINAVRMLTIHSSKGLEFSAVHMPRLGEHQFPAGQILDRCPLPQGLLPDEMLNWYMEEEECLFFVGLSRARDRLCISRARQYGRGESRESPLLRLVHGVLPRAIVEPQATRAARSARIAESPPTRTATRPFSEIELSVYIKCPLEYYYRYVLRISDRRADTAYAQSHLCVHRVWELIEERLHSGFGVDEETVSAVFDEVWEKLGPKDHPWKEDYRGEALAMVGQTLVFTSSGTRVLRPNWNLRLPSGDVIVRPDYTEIDESGAEPLVLMQDMRFGPSPSRSPTDDHYALYDMAAAEVFPKSRRAIQAVYMSNGDIMEVKVTAGARKAAAERYDRAIRGILRGEFEARPEERHCPYCPCFFICPAAEEVN
jgi:superfamily I DNA/RNA helicase